MISPAKTATLQPFETFEKLETIICTKMQYRINTIQRTLIADYYCTLFEFSASLFEAHLFWAKTLNSMECVLYTKIPEKNSNITT